MVLARIPGSEGCSNNGGTRTGLGGSACVSGARGSLPVELVELGGRESRVGDSEFLARDGVLEGVAADRRCPSRLLECDSNEDCLARCVLDAFPSSE